MLILTKFNLTHDHFGFDQIYLFRSDQYCFNLDKFDLTKSVSKSSILIIITLVFITSIFLNLIMIKFDYDKFEHVYFNHNQFDNDNNPCLCINFVFYLFWSLWKFDPFYNDWKLSKWSKVIGLLFWKLFWLCLDYSY